jgi:transcriptional regulator with GAF, ATPase, and Fis domain
MAGDTEMAGVGRLVMLEELSDRLTSGERVSLYLNACALLKETQNSRLLQRVCAQSSVIIGRLNVAPERASLKDMLMGGNLNDEMDRYEKELYRRALDEGKGSVTQAAQLLGVDHQRVSAALRGRFASLLPPEMKNRKKRARSIITK